MSARDRLTEILQTHPDYADMIAPEDVADEILGEHTQDLAEKIRREVIADPEFRSNFELGLDRAADLIDPNGQ